jgi:anhydro-N-acetylmuramic acid kinase
MDSILNLSKKNKKLVIGLMSGTSADGIDAAIVEITESGTETKIKQIAFETFPYDSKIKDYILRNSDAQTAKLDDIVRLNFLLGELFADAVLALVKKAGLKINEIDIIGSHGQTIHHLPENKKLFGKIISATLQIADPCVIAKRTGILTVGDFRTADIAVGGSGAPLIPYFDYLMFRSENKNRGLLNIGGIANITVIPKNASVENVFAFDTGPGNILIDSMMKRLFRKSFDDNGKTASRGKIIPQLLKWLMSDSYFRQNPPKSTGREYFGDVLLDRILRKSRNSSPYDIAATVSELTAVSIYESYVRFIKKKVALDELFVSGGGLHNNYLFDRLKKLFEDVNVLPIELAGYDADAKEAICFAVLANETISGNCTNLPKATGAERQTVLGKICLP